MAAPRPLRLLRSGGELAWFKVDTMILRFPRALWRQRDLCWNLSEREILGRYRGSVLGLAWTVLNPLAMLVVYTFVFSQVFKARWGTLENAGPIGFAINLFAGLIVFNLVAECLGRAPGLVLANPNYVKKVVFPLEVLAVVNVANATFHAIASLMVLLLFQLVVLQALPWTILLLPLVWLPLLIGCLAVAWILAGIGVFIRDIGQFISVALSMLMFLSPVFYPLSALPERYQPLLALSPLTHVIEQTRNILVNGKLPSLAYLIWGTLLALLLCELAFRAFSRAKSAFADVM